MSALSSVGFNSQSHTSPLQRLQNELAKEVQSGQINSADQSALSDALSSIDAALQSDFQSSQASGTRPSPDDIKSKIDDLISSQVDSGALTSDQAEELKSVFANAAPKGGPGGGGGPGGPGGAGGPPPGPPPSDSSDSDSDDTISSLLESLTSSTSSSEDSSSTNDLQTMLSNFLKSLQDTLNKSSTSYSSSGQSGSFSAALLIDYKS